MSPHDGGHSHRMGSGGSWVKALSQIISDESLTFPSKHILRGSTHFTFHGGALTSYIYFSYFQDDVIKRKYVPRYRPFVRSPVNSPHKGQWRGALMFSLIFAWTNGKQSSKQSRRRGYKTSSRSLWRHLMWCPIVIQPWDLLAFNASLLHSCPILNWWNGSNSGVGFPCIMEGMVSNLAHCSTLITIPWN